MAKKRVRSQAGKISSLGFIEIKEGLLLAAASIGRELRIGVEKWTQGHLLEAWIVDSLTLPREEQIRRAKRGQAIVERIRMRDEPGPPLGRNDDAAQGGSSGTAPPGNPGGTKGRGGRKLPKRQRQHTARVGVHDDRPSVLGKLRK